MRLISLLIAASTLLATAEASAAPPCRAKGKFVECDLPGARPA